MLTFRVPPLLFAYGPPTFAPDSFYGRPGLTYFLDPSSVIEVTGAHDLEGCPESSMIVVAVPIAVTIACVSPYLCGGDADAAQKYEFVGIDLEKHELYVVPKGRRLPVHGVRVRKAGREFTVEVTTGTREYLSVSIHPRAVAAQFRQAVRFLRDAANARI